MPTIPVSFRAPQSAAGMCRTAHTVRWLAWGAIVAAGGLLVRAEAHRPEVPRGVEAHTDIVYRRVDDRLVTLDVYVPVRPAPPRGRPTVLAIHGGGWCGGTKRDYG